MSASENKRRSCWKLWLPPFQFSRANFEEGWTFVYRIKIQNHSPLLASSSSFSLSSPLLSLYSKSQGEKEKKQGKNMAMKIKINNKEAERRNMEERVQRRAFQGEGGESSLLDGWLLSAPRALLPNRNRLWATNLSYACYSKFSSRHFYRIRGNLLHSTCYHFNLQST